MTYLNKVNTGGQDYRLSGLFLAGTCATPAGTEIKTCIFSDSFELVAGCSIAVLFTYANTYGDGSSTYPKLSVNSVSYPIKYSTGVYASTGAWANGQIVQFMFDGTNFILGSAVDEVKEGVFNPPTSNAVAQALSYSTTEHYTGKKWIDGKKIYAKTIDFGALPNSTTKNVAYNITNLDHFTKIDGIAYESTSDYAMQLPFISIGNVAHQIGIGVANGAVFTVSGANYSSYDKTYITLEYTKTTD